MLELDCRFKAVLDGVDQATKERILKGVQLCLGIRDFSSLSEAQVRRVEAEIVRYLAIEGHKVELLSPKANGQDRFEICGKCGKRAVVNTNGCRVCQACGESKCDL